MKLIRYIGKRLSKNNKKQSWGLFWCDGCKQEVEKELNPGKKAKSCGCQQYSDQVNKKISEALKGKSKSEEHKNKISKTRIEKGLAKGENNPMYGKNHTEESKQKIREASKLQVGENNPMYGKNHTEETRKKQSKAKKGKKLSIEHRNSLKRENHWNWQDGKSFEEYGIEFNKELKQFILERDYYTCQNPNCEYISNILDCHHIDFDKKNNNPENIITLCRSCHIQTNYNRLYWINYYNRNKRKLTQKNIIITGGMGLIGSQFVDSLLIEGANLFVMDLPEKIKDNKKKGDCTFFGLNLTDEYQIKKITAAIFKKYKHIDIIILCHAINPQPKEGENNSFENFSLQKWKNVLDVNLTSSFLMTRECIKYMLKNKNNGFKGTIINIASDLGLIASDHRIYENGYKKSVAYGVSKAGLINLTKYIAGYYRDKIKSVCLVPGSVYNGQSDSLKKNLEDKIPLGRLARPDEYNEAIKFLCSSGSDYMQGQALIADGGRSIW